MKHVTFEEYQAAKAKIIGGVQYEERSTLDGDVIHKTYTTERGTFYERNEGGRVEFWSDTHPESRIYDENERADSAPPADTNTATTAAPEVETKERVPGYGELLSDKIRTTTQDFSKLNEFEKFILDRGYLYDTEEELKAGNLNQHAWGQTEAKKAASVIMYQCLQGIKSNAIFVGLSGCGKTFIWTKSVRPPAIVAQQ